MTTRPLVELAKTIRSKNAGVDQITFDIVFRDRQTYELVKRSRALSPEAVTRLYAISRERLTEFVEFDPARAAEREPRRARRVRRAAVRPTLRFTNSALGAPLKRPISRFPHHQARVGG